MEVPSCTFQQPNGEKLQHRGQRAGDRHWDSAPVEDALEPMAVSMPSHMGTFQGRVSQW